MSDPRRLAELHLRAFNARDLDGWLALLHEDVRIVGDGGTWLGPAGAHAYAVEALRNNPGVVAAADRVVAESEDAIVIEFKLVRGERSEPSFLESAVCAVLQIRDRRIVELRNYYIPLASGPEGVRRPSRVGVDRLLREQQALRRVATLVAQGVSQDRLFAAVNEEVRRLVGSDAMALLRFEPGDEVTLVAARGDGADAAVALGERAKLDDRLRGVRDRGESVRAGPGRLPAAGGVRSWVGVPITVDGAVWGVALAASTGPAPLPDDTEARLAEFTELLATAIANAQARAELRRLIDELTASRARLVAAADESRHRIQRDLHDGAQQRLVSAIIALKLLKRALGELDGEPAELLEEALAHSAQANAELRELVHGIMPAALLRGGLRSGIRSLAERVHLEIEQDVTSARFSQATEVTAYFAVAEALTNVVKHAGVQAARVEAAVRGDALEIAVRDDGAGGAGSADGSGLRGLVDRVTASGGEVEIVSPPGAGTTVTVRLPVARQP